MRDTRGAGRDLLIALAVVAAVGAACDGCRAEPSRIDRIMDAGTDRTVDELRNREAPVGGR